MNEILSERFANLLDPDFQDHVIAAMKKWCFGERCAIDAKQADLVDEDISTPLCAWIDETQRQRKPGNYSDIEAAKEFAVNAGDVVYILRYGTRQLYPEHIAMLNDAWAQFQREIAHGLYAGNRILKEFIGSQPSVKDHVAEELQRRADEKKRESEIRKRNAQEKWQKAGVDAARKYTENDENIWHEAGKRILKEHSEIKSIRGLTRKIQEETNYPYEAEETIRKTKSIVSLMKIHKLNKNIG